MAQTTVRPAVAATLDAPGSWRVEFERETVAHWRALGWVLLQVVAIGVLVRLLVIEGPVFARQLVPLALVGSVVHHLLPRAYRLSFFGLLSLTAIWMVFGLVDGAWIVSAGMALILLCHLPVAFAVRVGLLLGAGLLLAMQRVGLAPSPWSASVWPIFGSMFMFRLIVYMYELRHTKQPTRWDERIAYFFCLPNVAFPLFPVLDFSTFRRTYYDRPAPEIYREGIRWIVRGLTHLVLYRVVYQYLTIAPVDVVSGTKLVQYMVATYALYLRVSGQFHLIIGLLHLFGFRLPETHKFFYLASSFSDLWKRINIYWKDFMQKVFYLPVFFRLMRTRGETFALVVSTLVVFVVTWALHSYQWFWVLGTWLFSWTDTAFWAILALCLVANLLWEQRRGRTRSLGAPTRSARQLIEHGVQTAGMFAVMCLLWTLWSARTPEELRSLFTRAVFGWSDAAVVGAVLGAVALIAMIAYRRANTPTIRQPIVGLDKATLSGFACLGLLVGGATGPGARVLPPRAYAVAVNVREGRLNALDLAQQRRGYYEEMTNVSRFNPELWRRYGGVATPSGDRPLRTGVLMRVKDARVQIVRPNYDQENTGARVQTNEWGLRDKPYTLAKPKGTWRIAIFGPSLVFGTGVKNEEIFEALVEDRLNAELAGQPGKPTHYEILNFGVPASSPWQHLATMRLGYVERFAPDVVLMIGARNELWNSTKYWQDVLKNGAEHPLPAVVGLLKSTGITAAMNGDSAELRMAPVRDTLLVALYGALVSEIRRMHAIPVYAPIEMPLQRREGSVLPLLQKAERAGFGTFDLSYVYDGRDEYDLILSEANAHPNPKGHQVIADGLYDQLIKRPSLLGIASDSTAPRRR